MELDLVCVLDFYIEERVQRNGIGKSLFEYMLLTEKKEACELGYDRPSFRLLPFLEKQFGLQHYVPQHIHFVIFNEYFQ